MPHVSGLQFVDHHSCPFGVPGPHYNLQPTDSASSMNHDIVICMGVCMSGSMYALYYPTLSQLLLPHPRAT